jgi:EAL domain-containing protein (putative c-di-GMP-specific phosphodiesterase class I)
MGSARQVPADILKLDRVFTRSLCTETRQREIVELIISMAKVMDLTVVAEGVENEDQRELLPRMGCDLLQGYLVGRPIAPDEFAARWLAAGPSEETSAAWTGWQGPSDARMR